jgi:hypothetical protein
MVGNALLPSRTAPLYIRSQVPNSRLVLLDRVDRELDADNASQRSIPEGRKRDKTCTTNVVISFVPPAKCGCHHVLRNTRIPRESDVCGHRDYFHVS